MKRRPALAVVPEPVADPVAAAQAAIDVAAGELEAARTAEAEAQRAYDQDERLQDSAARARVARERCERRLTTAREVLAAAERTRRDEQRAADEQEMQRAIAFVASLTARARPDLEQLVALDRQASAIVDRIADRVVEGQDVFDRATELAMALERPHEVQRQVRRPSLSWLALLARIAIQRDRVRTARDLANGWVESATEPAWDSTDRPAYDAACKELDHE